MAGHSRIRNRPWAAERFRYFRFVMVTVVPLPYLPLSKRISMSEFRTGALLSSISFRDKGVAQSR